MKIFFSVMGLIVLFQGAAASPKPVKRITIHGSPIQKNPTLSEVSSENSAETKSEDHTRPFLELSGPASLDEEESKLLELLNNYRVQNSAEPLKLSVPLTYAADWKVYDILNHGFGSVSPSISFHTDSRGLTPTQLMKKFGHSHGNLYGENLTTAHANASHALGLWKQSPRHNENMLDPAFTVVGLARRPMNGIIWGWVLELSN